MVNDEKRNEFEIRRREERAYSAGKIEGENRLLKNILGQLLKIDLLPKMMYEDFD